MCNLKQGKVELLILIILSGSLLYILPAKSLEHSYDNTNSAFVLNNPETQEFVNQKIVSHTLENSTIKVWNLYKGYSKAISIGTENLTNIFGLIVPNYNFLSSSVNAFLNLSISIEFKAETTLYHSSPLFNDTHFSLGKSANMMTNLYFALEGGYEIVGSIGNKVFSDEFYFFKDGDWSYQIPTEQWEISLFKIPILGDYLSRFLRFDFGFNIDAGDFTSSFHGFISLEPKIICQTSYVSETFIDRKSAGKCVLDTPGEVKIVDIMFQEAKGQNNITLEERLDCVLESRLALDCNFGYDYYAELDLSNLLFELYPSISFEDEFSRSIESKSVIINLGGVEFQPYTIEIRNYEEPYMSKNLLEKTIIETPFSFPTFNLSLSNGFSVFLPFPLDTNVSLELSLELTFAIEGKHRIQLIAPRCANINDTIDLLLVPLSTESQITGDLNLNLYFSIPFILFENITLSRHSSFVESMNIPLGIEENDPRGFMSSFLPQIYDETSVAINLGPSFEHSQLVLDLAPIVLSDQLMTFNLSSSDFSQNEGVILRSSESKLTTLTITNGSIYDQLQANFTGDGLLQTNSSLQPKLYFKADLLGKTITVPLPIGSLLIMPISSHNLSGTLITKSIQIPTFFIDKDTTPPVIVGFQSVWYIEDLSVTNVLDLTLKETQSGLKEPIINGNGAQISSNFNESMITLILFSNGLDRESERRWSNIISINLEDNKGNSNSYEIHVYFEIPYDSPEYTSSTSDFDENVIYGILAVIGVGGLVVWLFRKK